jgi:hypothetical protein
MLESAAPLPETLSGHRCPAGLICFYPGKLIVAALRDLTTIDSILCAKNKKSLNTTSYQVIRN